MKKILNTTKSIFSLTSQPFSGWFDSLSNAIRSSTNVSKPTANAILKHISSAIKSLPKHAGGAVNLAVITTNAILASNFSQNMNSWLGGILNKGVPSIYDKAIDKIYNDTHVGGHLHRLFDGSHTPLGMWDKVRDTLPDDTILDEFVGYINALGKDISTPAGIPLSTWSQTSYDQVANFLNTTCGISKTWFSDLISVDPAEIFGTSIGIIALTLNWDDEQKERFAHLAGHLGISSIVSANPLLAIIALVALSKSFVNANKKGDCSEIVDGVFKGGVVTGVFLATSSVIGGPVWIGILAGMCVGGVAHKHKHKVDISEITTFVYTSLRNQLGRLHPVNYTS